MKYDTTNLPNQQVKVVTEVEPEKLVAARKKAVQQISSRNKIPGFRPGKAPIDVVRRLFGDESIEQHAIDILIDEVYPQIIKENGLDPSGSGKLEEIISRDPVKLSFIIPLRPTIDLGNYKSIRLAYKNPIITQDEVEKVLTRLQLNASTTEESQNPAGIGNLVAATINARLANPDAEETPEVIKDSPMQFIVGSADENFPYPGFSNELIGMNTGQNKEFRYKYKKDTSYEKLSGKEVVFNVSIESVKVLIKPELNDDFAKTMGFDTFELLKSSISRQLLETKTKEYDNKYYSELIDKIIVQAKINYPPHLLDEEIESVQRSFEQELSHQNLDFDTYLKINQLEKEKFIESELKPAAIRRLEQSLIVEEVGRQENIELAKDELQQVYTQTLLEMQAVGELQRLQRKVSPKRLSNAMVMQAASKLMNKRVLETLKNIATGQYEESKDIGAEKPVTKKPKSKKAENND